MCLYKDILNKIHNIANKTDIKDGSALADILAKRLVIYKLGEMQMWWNSNIFTNEGLLYMKVCFLILSYKYDTYSNENSKKGESTYLNSKENISFCSLTDELGGWL